MNTTDARDLINQCLNQLRAARSSEDMVVTLMDELDRAEVAVARALRSELIDAMEAQAYRNTIQAILEGTDPAAAPAAAVADRTTYCIINPYANNAIVSKHRTVRTAAKALDKARRAFYRSHTNGPFLPWVGVVERSPTGGERARLLTEEERALFVAEEQRLQH